MPGSNRAVSMLCRRFHAASLLLIALSLAVAACGTSARGRITAVRAATLGRWTATAHIRRVLDLSSPRSDGAIVVAAAGRLALLSSAAGARPFATGPAGYASPGGEEPYVALSSGERVRGADCTFGTDTLYALRLVNGPGVTVVDSQGRARRLRQPRRPRAGERDRLDDTGRFGHRLLVTATAGSKTTVYAIDCRGGVTMITEDAPRVEGGIVVAPATFGRFAET